jgi:hypothetical protein
MLVNRYCLYFSQLPLCGQKGWYRFLLHSRTQFEAQSAGVNPSVETVLRIGTLAVDRAVQKGQNIWTQFKRVRISHAC